MDDSREKKGPPSDVNDRAFDRWQPGAVVLIRYVWRNRVWYAEPVTVVQDAPERLIAFWAGTLTSRIRCAASLEGW